MNDYLKIYSQDNPATPSSGWIQWRGTDVCVDIHCKCGYSCHVDGKFFYYWKCPDCGQVHAIGQNIKLISLSEEQVENIRGNPCVYIDEMGPISL